MKSLYKYLTEQMISESFASDALRNLFFSMRPRVRNDNSFSNHYPMWDKITDNDIKRLDIEEAKKRMRSRKEPGYLIWFKNDGNRFRGITWGCDVVMTYDGSYKNVTASSIADDSEGAYEIEDVFKFIRSDIRKDRAEAKRDAVALISYDKIKSENLARYEKKLAKLRNPGLESVLKIYKDAMEIYKNVTDKYIAKFVSIMQEGNGSFFSMKSEWERLNKIIIAMASDINMYNHSNGYNDDKNAMQYFKQISEAASRIEEIANTFETNSK